MRWSTSGFALFAVLAIPASMAAQAPAKAPAEAPPITAKAPKLFAGIGIGQGSFRFSCPAICTGDRYWGWSGNARVGVSFGKLWLMGIEGTGWTDSRDPENQQPIKQTMWLVGPVAYFYPTPKQRLYLKLSLGVMHYQQHNPDDADNENDQFSSTTFGASAGVGYDFRVAKHVFISPFFAFVGSAGGDVTQGNGNTVTTDPNFSLLQFGVSLLYR